MRRPSLQLLSTLHALNREGKLLTLRQALVMLALMPVAWVLDYALGPASTGHAQAIWWYVAVIVVSAILSYALAPKPAQPPKPTLEDLDMPTAEEGRPIPVVFGEVWIKGANIIWYGDLDTTPIKVKGGKK